jgi:hypothetical protein
VPGVCVHACAYTKPACVWTVMKYVTVHTQAIFHTRHPTFPSLEDCSSSNLYHVYHLYAYTHIHMFIPTHAHTHTHIYIYPQNQTHNTRTHIRIYIYIHIQYAHKKTFSNHARSTFFFPARTRTHTHTHTCTQKKHSRSSGDCGPTALTISVTDCWIPVRTEGFAWTASQNGQISPHTNDYDAKNVYQFVTRMIMTWKMCINMSHEWLWRGKCTSIRPPRYVEMALDLSVQSFRLMLWSCM